MISETMDGQSLYGTFGATLSPDSIGNLLKYPTREAVRQTDFAESHGIQVDLRSFRLQRRRIPLAFQVSSEGGVDLRGRLKAFTDALSAPGWRAFDFGLNVPFSLRYVSTQSLSIHGPSPLDSNGATVVVTMEEGTFPLSAQTSYTVLGPRTIPHTPRGEAAIRGVDIGQYGASLDDVYIGAAAAPAELKAPYNDGRTLHLDAPRRKSADWTLYIDLAAPTLDHFIHNWSALYNAIAAPGTFPLYLRERGTTSEVFYRDCTACTAIFGTWHAAKMQIKVTCPTGE